MPANNANAPTNATIGTQLAVWGSDARAICAGAPPTTGFASMRAGMTGLAIEVDDDAMSPCWLAPPGVEAVGVASALTFVS